MKRTIIFLSVLFLIVCLFNSLTGSTKADNGAKNPPQDASDYICLFINGEPVGYGGYVTICNYGGPWGTGSDGCVDGIHLDGGTYYIDAWKYGYSNCVRYTFTPGNDRVNINLQYPGPRCSDCNNEN